MARLLSGCVVRVAWLPLALLLAAAPAAAQQSDEQAPAHISIAEGTVILERDGRPDSAPASMPLLAGDRVRTQNGRVEILFTDGSTLHLDANTTVDVQSDEVIRLLDGRVRVTISGPQRPIAYRIDAPAAWVQITQPGEYRVSLVAGERAPEVELAVLRGAAELVNEGGTTRVQAGERAFAASGLAPSQPYVFNSAAWDDFDRWSEARRTARLGVTGEYIPAEVQSYAPVFNEYGSWRQEPTYGYVWYPRVSVGWRPYYRGRWSHLRPWGWTWIGHDPWAWPTHHYGRWGFSAGLWFWIPGRHWGPAWVSWAYAPGYVSWCPLGWNNRPVFSFINVNVFGGRRYTPWHAWTVVPHRRFGSGFVNVNVVNINRLDLGTRRAFAVRDRAPESRGFAVPRSQTPIRVAGARSGVAVRRGGAAAAPQAAGREAVRGAGSSGAALSGPGFPAPARQPNRAAVPRSGSRSAPAATAPPAARSAAPRGSRSAPATSAPPAARPAAPRGSRSAPATSAPRSESRPAAAAPERTGPTPRAVPQGNRGASGGAVRRSPGGTAPAAPAATPPPRGSGSGGASAPASSGRSGAVRRSGGGSASRAVPSRSTRPEASRPPARADRYRAAPRPNDSRAYQPTPAPRSTERPQYGVAPRRSGPEQRSAPSYRPERATPSRPPAASRPSGRPSGGPPSRSVDAPSRGGPSRPSASPAPSRGGSRGSAGAPSRSRGGGPPSGGGRPRGGN